jgi:hypothetical protein
MRAYIAKQYKTRHLLHKVPFCSLEEVWKILVTNYTWIIRELTFPDLISALYKSKKLL